MDHEEKTKEEVVNYISNYLNKAIPTCRSSSL